MHHLFQRGKIRSQNINVPEGLPELLSDITREVLRCQPTTECLCQFIIDYLQSVIKARDKSMIAKSMIDRALRIVDEVIADLCICNIPSEKSDYMSTAMEECFKRFLEHRRCEKVKDKEMIKFSDSDMLDEIVQKCKFTEDELKITKPAIETAYKKFVDAYMTAKDSTDGTDCLYQYFRKRENERMEQHLRVQSAIKIQSSFRGYLVRRSLFSNGPAQQSQHSSPAASNIELDQNELEVAALKIQRFYRRYKGEFKDADVESGKRQSSEGACSPVSNISLNVQPADHDATDGKDNEARESQNQNQNELIPENEDHIDLQNEMNEAEEDAMERDFISEDMEEYFQNE